MKPALLILMFLNVLPLTAYSNEHSDELKAYLKRKNEVCKNIAASIPDETAALALKAALITDDAELRLARESIEGLWDFQKVLDVVCKTLVTEK